MTKVKDRIVTLLAYVIITVGVTYFFFPIYWMIQTSLKPGYIQQFPPVLLFEPTLQWYVSIFTPGGMYIVPYMITSLITTLSSTALVTILGSMAAYGLSRFQFRFSGRLAFLILLPKLLPAMAFLIPLWLFYRYVKLYDSLLGLILVYTAFGLPFFTWLMFGFFSELPKEVEESAMVDGCSRLRAFWSISLPLVAPGLAAASVLTMIFTWNDFMFAGILTERNVVTLPIALTYGISGMSGSGAAYGIIMSLPMMIAGAVIQRYLVRGMTFGTVKG